MKQSYSACICKDGKWWMGVVKEVRGVMSQGRTKRELMENLQSALEEALEMNREHALSGMRDIDYQEIELQVSSEA